MTGQPSKPEPTAENFSRLERPASLISRVEQLLREAIAGGRFEGGRLPTEVELAEQLGVSRETVRLAAENLQREGLLVKIRRKGTFLEQPHRLPERIEGRKSLTIAYLQAGYQAAPGQEEGVTRIINGLMLQGAIEEAGSAGFRLLAQHTLHTQIGKVFQELHQDRQLRGVIFASYGEEKLLRRAAGLGLPTVLLDHDLHLSQIHSVRDDSFQGAREAVAYLVSQGHKRIAFANWRQTDLNPWRLQGYRQGLRDAGLVRRRSWEFSVELTEAGARDVVVAWEALTPRPSALYCFNNTLARLVGDELKRRNILVPQELSLLGGGGEEVSGLTCHQADWFDMGKMAVRILLRQITQPEGSAVEHHLSPHTIRAGTTVRMN